MWAGQINQKHADRTGKSETCGHIRAGQVNQKHADRTGKSETCGQDR